MAEDIEPRSRRNTRQKPKKKRPLYLLLIILLIIVIIGAFGYQKLFNNTAPVSTAAAEQKMITIPKGASTKSISALLYKEGLIQSESSFNHYVRKNDYDGKLRNGDYLLSADMSVEQIVDKLLSGIGETERFTIPEGYTLEDIAAVFAKQGAFCIVSDSIE